MIPQGHEYINRWNEISSSEYCMIAWLHITNWIEYYNRSPHNVPIYASRLTYESFMTLNFLNIRWINGKQNNIKYSIYAVYILSTHHHED